MNIIETPRILLRAWHQADIASYYEINQDPKVIQFLQGSLTLQEVKDFINLMNHQYEKKQYTLFAAEEKQSGKYMGFVGLNQVKIAVPFISSIEIGWRLGSQFWRQGYATEAATAVLKYGFEALNLVEIIAYTAKINSRSIRLMEKIGMQRDELGDFTHPKLPCDHKLSSHVLYRIHNKK